MGNYVISLKRTFGSEAVPIAKAVAAQLGITYLEDSLLREVAPVQLKNAIDELSELEGDDLATATDNVFMMKSALLRKLAETESFLVVGKAADYLGNDIPNVLRINFNSNYEDRIKTVAERDGLSKEEAVAKIRKGNSERAERYEKFTGCAWNDPLGFDLTLNASKIGRERCAKLIIKYVELVLEEDA